MTRLLEECFVGVLFDFYRDGGGDACIFLGVHGCVSASAGGTVFMGYLAWGV